jgi:TIR domain-containing protein
MDNVECSVFAPGKPERGRQILVQALLHRIGQLAVAAKIASAADADANRKGFAKLSTKIERGALVQLFLEIQTLEIATTPLQEVTWEGEPVRVAYSVDVPLTARLGLCQGTLHIMLEGVPVGEILFELHIEERKSAKPNGLGSDMPLGIVPEGATESDDQRPEPVAVTAMKFKRAFVSYSRRDAEQVLLFAEALDDCGIEPLFDLTSIEPGEEWEERLPKLIDKADVFYLMWSRNAALSQWVEKETLAAVARYDNDSKRVPRIRPVIIEQPMPEPPTHLRRFQFHSKWIALRTAQTHSLFSTADRQV